MPRRDPLPLPKYQERYCAFVDILGFRQLIDELRRDTETYDEVRGILDVVHGPTAMVDEDEDSDLRAQSISDAICISTKCSEKGLETIMLVLQHLFRQMLEYGYLVRGALVKGMLYHDDRMVFGPAQVQAYEIERDVARFPRIMISSPVVDDVSSATFPGLSDRLGRMIVQGEDGPRHLDILKILYETRDTRLSDAEREDRRYRFNQIAATLQKQFDASFDNPRHFEKQQWFARYWNLHAYRAGIQLIMRFSFDGLSRVPV